MTCIVCAQFKSRPPIATRFMLLKQPHLSRKAAMCEDCYQSVRRVSKLYKQMIVKPLSEPEYHQMNVQVFTQAGTN